MLSKVLLDGKANFRPSFLGALCGFAAPPFYIFPFFVFSIFAFARNAIGSRTAKELLLQCFVFAGTKYCVELYWLVLPLTFEWPRYAVFMPLVPLVIFLVFGVLFALCLLPVSLVQLRLKTKSRLVIVTLFALCWGLFDVVRSYVLSGFAWNLTIYNIAFSDSLMQVVYFADTYLAGTILVFLCALPACSKKLKSQVALALPLLASLLLTYFCGLDRIHKASVSSGSEILIRVVQPNISTKSKHTEGSEYFNFLEHIRLSKTLAVKDVSNKILLVIWPESAMNFLIKNYGGAVEKDIQEMLKGFIDNGFLSAQLITGAIRMQEGNDGYKLYNSVFSFNNNTGDAFEYYDKRHLVPFGEYNPFSLLGTIAAKGDGFSKGSKTTSMQAFNVGSRRALPVICYEITFPNAIKRAISYNKLGAKDFIINVTNDSWFGETSAPEQHLVSARFRAIENNITVIRAANTGISAVIDSHGRLIKTIPSGKKGIIEWDGL